MGEGNKLSLKFGELTIINKGKIYNHYNENDAAKYMKNLDININVDDNQHRYEH